MQAAVIGSLAPRLSLRLWPPPHKDCCLALCKPWRCLGHAAGCAPHTWPPGTLMQVPRCTAVPQGFLTLHARISAPPNKSPDKPPGQHVPRSSQHGLHILFSHAQWPWGKKHPCWLADFLGELFPKKRKRAASTGQLDIVGVHSPWTNPAKGPRSARRAASLAIRFAPPQVTKVPVLSEKAERPPSELKDRLNRRTSP